MEPRRLTIRGLTRFTTEIALDFDPLPDGLIAVAGSNGSGKTTIMEAMAPGPLYLELPSRPGTLYRLANRRDASMELVHDYQGRTWRHLIEVDPGTGTSGERTEAYLWELAPGAELPPAGEAWPEGLWVPVDGWPTPGRVGDYKAALAGLGFPSRDVFLAGPFSVHTGAGNFLELSTSARRDLFSTLLGLGELEALATRAGEARKPLDAALGELQELAQALEADRQAAQALRDQVTRLEAEVAAEGLEVARLEDGARKAAEAATRAKAELDQLHQARRVILERRQELEDQVRRAGERCATLDRQILEDEALEADAEAIRARAQELQALTERRAQLLGEREGHQAKREAAGRELVQARQELGRIADSRRRLEGQIQELGGVAARLQELDGRLAGLEDARQALEVAGAELDQVKGQAVKAEAAHRERQAGATRPETVRVRLDRLERDAKLLAGVPCKGAAGVRVPSSPGDVDCGACQFLQDARTAAGQLEAVRLELEAAEATALELAQVYALAQELRGRVGELEGEREAARRALQDLERLEAEAARLRDRLERRGDLDQELEALNARGVELTTATVPELERRQADATAAVERVDAEGRKIRQDLDHRLQGAAERARALDVAAARLPERRQELEGAQEDRRRAGNALADLQVPEEPREASQRVYDLEAADRVARDLVVSAQASLAQLRESLGHARGRLDELGDLEARAEALDQARTDLGRRRAGFRELERACGKTGIQVLEIDAAGPTVSALCNDLLAATFGGRFAVRLDTTREGGRGKIRETFDLVVLDGNRKGRAEDSAGDTRKAEARERLAADVSELSKGEKVLVDEALKLAIAMFHAQRHGAQVLTLWRDECDTGLDPENRRRYPAMLRRALAIGGFRRLYFVSHDPDVQAQADAVLRVSPAPVERVDVEIA